jgi:NADPH:quinone reductase-like Zn-dependent oxidoreductase
MQAARAFSADVSGIVVESVPVPVPGPDELLVRVRATAVTADELTWPEAYPQIPCHDLSGVVAATGPGVAGWQPGDAIYGLVGFDLPGAAAEYVTVPAADMAARPASVDPVAAAALPLGALTAWQALHQHAAVRPGQHVLVHGGAGGVGAYAVQLAAAAGAEVTATASARDHEFVADLGARRVIDYTGRFEDEVSGADIVIDPVGGETMARSWPVLRPGGILVAIAQNPRGQHGGREDVRGVFFVVEPDGPQLRELARLADDGLLRPVVSAVFGLSEIAEAFRAQRSRHRPGKVLIEVPG